MVQKTTIADLWEVFEKACTYVEEDYIDREFINHGWPELKKECKSRITEVFSGLKEGVVSKEDVSSFESVMTEFITNGLPLSHTLFMTPSMCETADKQDSGEEAPEFLYASYRETSDFTYLKVPTMTIPLFSWDYLREILEDIVSDYRPLVLDLRLNSGGAASATGELLAPFIGPAKHFLTGRLVGWEDVTPVTVYPFNEHENHGNALDVQAMFNTVHAHWKTPAEADFCLKQKVILLSGERNYSCGEVFTQAMKEYGRATIVGGTSAGAVVGARDDFDCGQGYRLMLPFVDMLSRDGVVIEGRGVEPHIPMEFETGDIYQLTDKEVAAVLQKVCSA